MSGPRWPPLTHGDLELACRLVITLVILIGAGIELDLNAVNQQTASALIGILGVIIGYWFSRVP